MLLMVISEPTVAELCAGYGGLVMATQLINPAARLQWVAETDPDASAVLAHHHHVPNHGDITNPLNQHFGLPKRHLQAPRRARQQAKRTTARIAAWAATAQPVDIIAAGFPCQPFSTAGRRAGTADERHLWPTGVLPAITALAPQVVLCENVPGLRTVQHGKVFHTILADLMGLGYTVRWTTIGACRLGMCHHRHRIFIMATQRPGELPYELGMPLSAWSSWPTDGVASDGLVWQHHADTCGTAALTLPTPTARDTRRGAGRAHAEGRPLSEVIALLPTPVTADGTAGIGNGCRRDGKAGVPNLRTAVTLLPTPTVADGTAGPGHSGREGAANLRTQVTLLPTPLAGRDSRGLPSADVAEDRIASGRRNLDDALALLPTPTASPYGSNQSPSAGAAVRPSLDAISASDQWGQYAAAIERHTAVVNRPAPRPTITGRRGGQRLNPELTE
jgi:DNA (cytosine-5)-methyltransferase 1